MTVLPLALIIAVLVQLSCQAFKVVFYSIREGAFAPKYFVSAGGVPSAHSAFVTALATSIGIHAGFGSDLFAVAATFALIVIYDAFRLRGQVEAIAKAVNRRVLAPAGEEPVSEMIGHTLPEIAAGIAVGVGLSTLFTRLLG